MAIAQLEQTKTRSTQRLNKQVDRAAVLRSGAKVEGNYLCVCLHSTQRTKLQANFGCTN